MEKIIRFTDESGNKRVLTLNQLGSPSYTEMLAFDRKVRECLDSAPIKFAFGTTQENEMLAEWGLTRSAEDLDKIADIGCGGYALKTDIPKIKQIYANVDQIQIDFYDKNHDVFAEKVLYEFYNYPEKKHALTTFKFTPNTINKRIVKAVYKFWCKMCEIECKSVWIDRLFVSLANEHKK